MTDVGPQLVSAHYVCSQKLLRRVGHIYFNRKFANAFLSAAVQSNASFSKIASIFAARSTTAGGELASMIPTRSRGFWHNVLEDIVESPVFCAAIARYLQECGQRTEYAYLSIDATVQCLLKVVGMATYRHSAVARASMPVPEDEAVYKMMTVRGRTGALVAVQGIKSEAASNVAQVLEARITADQRDQTVHVASDSPSSELFRVLRTVLPRLETLSLDATHICMAYQHCHSQQKTNGCKWLRLIMAKFAAVDPNCPRETWGPPYTGNGEFRFTTEEAAVRRRMVEDTMTREEGVHILSRISPTTPWYTVVQFLEAISALCAVYPEELSRTNTQGTSLRKLLHNLCVPQKIQWLLNDSRFRHAQSCVKLQLLPSGTTSNESLHHEINVWFRETVVALARLHSNQHGTANKTFCMFPVSRIYVILRSGCI